VDDSTLAREHRNDEGDRIDHIQTLFKRSNNCSDITYPIGKREVCERTSAVT
jgi:hypothetical protein